MPSFMISEPPLSNYTHQDKNAEVHCHPLFCSASSLFSVFSYTSFSFANSPPMKSPPLLQVCPAPNTNEVFLNYLLICTSPSPPSLFSTCLALSGARKTEHTLLCDYAYMHRWDMPPTNIQAHTHTKTKSEKDRLAVCSSLNINLNADLLCLL